MIISLHADKTKRTPHQNMVQQSSNELKEKDVNVINNIDDIARDRNEWKQIVTKFDWV